MIELNKAIQFLEGLDDREWAELEAELCVVLCAERCLNPEEESEDER
jgi:hypothetical protein